MAKKSLLKLINTSLLISPEMQAHLRDRIATFTEPQQQEMTQAIEQSEQDLQNILTAALRNNPEKLKQIQHKLDNVWKDYLKQIESASESAETQDEQALLNKLKE